MELEGEKELVSCRGKHETITDETITDSTNITDCDNGVSGESGLQILTLLDRNIRYYRH